KTEVFAAVSVLLQRDKGERADSALIVKTCKDCLWQVFCAGREQHWEMNEDQAKGWVIAHRARLFRISQDRWFERRRPRKERAGLNGLRADPPKKYDYLFRAWCQKAARMLVTLARRQKCGHIDYDDSETGFCPGLPWFKLRAMIEQKCSEFNVR